MVRISIKDQYPAQNLRRKLDMLTPLIAHFALKFRTLSKELSYRTVKILSRTALHLSNTKLTMQGKIKTTFTQPCSRVYYLHNRTVS